MARVLRGELWLVRFDPAQGAEIKKTRPALILQNDITNAHGSTTIVAAVTTTIDTCYPNETLLASTSDGLPRTSKVLLQQVRSVDKRRLIKRLGRITPDQQRAVDEALKISLGLVPLD